MKIKRGFLCAFIFSIMVCGFGYAQPSDVEIESERPVNAGLINLRKIYVSVIPDKVTQIDREGVEEEISRKLTESGLDILSGESAKAPELIVRVSVLQGQGAGPCIYHIQTSFARQVYLRSPRASLKAEIWRLDAPIAIAEANTCDMTVRDAILRHLDVFIAEWKMANEKPQAAASPAVVTPVVARPQEQKPQRSEDVEYVASKNSKVFHRSDCSSAKRISSENVIRFVTKEEAISSGRRPCKICKP
jgi:hypothetical protein